MTACSCGCDACNAPSDAGATGDKRGHCGRCGVCSHRVVRDGRCVFCDARFSECSLCYSAKVFPLNTTRTCHRCNGTGLEPERPVEQPVGRTRSGEDVLFPLPDTRKVPR